MDDFVWGLGSGIIIGILVMALGAVIWLAATSNPSTTINGSVGYMSTSDGSTTFIIGGQTVVCSLTTSSVPTSIVSIQSGDTVTIQHYSNNACTVIQDVKM
jgi:hypothetical protein